MQDCVVRPVKLYVCQHGSQRNFVHVQQLLITNLKVPSR
jgi:hypothetical protein